MGMIVIAFGFISGMLYTKYRPVYAVTIGNENVGYVENKEDFEKEIEKNIINYKAKNVDSVEIKETPTYELKFVDRQEATNEKEIIMAMQKDMTITYKYYEIALDKKVIQAVDNKDEAEKLIKELKSKHKGIKLTLTEKETKKAEEINTKSIEVAKKTFTEKIVADEKKAASVIGEVKGIKLAVKPVQGIITSRYGVSSRIRVSTHTGLDIATSAGTPIKVVSDGTIISAKYTGAYGNLVKVSHGNGVETWYAHTSKMYVKAGQKVKAGHVIAAVGSTGNSTGPHLHFEIRINGNHVNPQIYMYK